MGLLFKAPSMGGVAGMAIDQIKKKKAAASASAEPMSDRPARDPMKVSMMRRRGGAQTAGSSAAVRTLLGGP